MIEATVDSRDLLVLLLRRWPWVVLAGVLGFLSVWMAAAVAHEVRGWRTLLLAILPALVIVVAFAVIFVLLLGMGVIWNGC